ncbi:hypothetical protein CERSUDRAFT_117667 [Gelatoporia subvermispora B]|uniref:C2 domain-containing protein n=1 Tax=Ceriporiopsis subvermispora (strain B) TaxID=914234 RepID=M2R707_CERS8|nr:hypothetical protein CERSUDRAFT_117667 [Gelatoporia subvermispora B]
MTDELGTLVIVVLKARNLHDKHSLYKQDVFAQIALNDHTQKTGVDVRGGQHPVWDQELRISIPKNASEKTRTLEVSCWSKEPRTDEVIGKGKVDITDTLRTGEFDDWVPLELNGGYRGELYLEMTFFAAGPPPLNRRPSKFLPTDRLARPTQPYLYPAPNRTPPKTPPKTPQALPLRSRPNSASYDPLTFAPLPPSPNGAHRSPPSVSPHRGRDSPLPPLPDAHLSPASIPAILRPGNPTSPPRATQAPLPPEHPLHTHAPRTSSQSPPRAVPTLPPNPRPAAPPSLRPGAPPEARPYPYNHPPPPPEPELPDPYLTAPTFSLPLPDDPSGVSTPTPANPYPYVPAPVQHASRPTHAPHASHSSHTSHSPHASYSAPPSQPSHPHSPSYSPSHSPSHSQSHSHPSPAHTPRAAPSSTSTVPAHTKTHSRQERDRLLVLALALEREEDARRRRLAEQEERDRELARKLDLELNLEAEAAAGRAEVAPGAGPEPTAMPGGW